MALAVGLTVLVACTGGDDKNAASTGTTLPLVTTTTIPPPTVVIKTDATLGTILADSAGFTLYTLTDDDDVQVACDAACAAVWPPLEVPAGGMLPTGGQGVGLLGVAPGPDGTLVVTHGGLSLFRFKQDNTPADAKGEGVESFGGTWHVVRVGESATTTSSSTSTTVARTTPPTEPEPEPDTTPDTTPDTSPDTAPDARPNPADPGGAAG